MKQVLIFVNGDVADGLMVRRVLAESKSPYVVAADGGARVADYFELPIDCIVGDMDSISTERLERLRKSGSEIITHPPEKDFTDLELALKHVVERGYHWIRIIGSVGGRIDQTLANIYLLALPELKSCDVRLVADTQSVRLLSPGEYSLTGKKGDTLSLIPLGGDVDGIVTEGLYYPLKKESLYFGPARGISNVMSDNSASVAFETGQLLVIHTLGKA